MFWWIYDLEDTDPRPRLMESAIRPTQYGVINHGFASVMEAFSVLMHYVEIDDQGFMHLDLKKADMELTFLDRMQIALHVAPVFIWLEVITSVAAISAFILILVHVL